MSDRTHPAPDVACHGPGECTRCVGAKRLERLFHRGSASFRVHEALPRPSPSKACTRLLGEGIIGFDQRGSALTIPSSRAKLAAPARPPPLFVAVFARALRRAGVGGPMAGTGLVGCFVAHGPSVRIS